MNTTAYIDKFKGLKESEDYALLRRRGIEYLEKMASRLWTDYNVHDPGITTLEVLCYALTDLGYRMSYPIEDILAEGTTPPSESTPGIRNFFSAREILPCNPVTLDDFRALMIDVPGVRNAWLEMVDRPEPTIYVDCSRSELTLTPRFKLRDESLTCLEKKGVPAAVRQELDSLKGTEYATEEGFLTALKALPLPGGIELYQSDILLQCAFVGPGRRIEPVHLQGLYDVILELETDYDHGDLNQYVFVVDVPSGTASFPVEVVLPAWDVYFNESIKLAKLEAEAVTEIEQLTFGDLSYIQQRGVYEGWLTVAFKDDRSLEKLQYRVIRLGPKPEQCLPHIEKALESSEEGLRESYQARLKCALSIVEKVYEKLHEHRNLCEDFCRFKAIGVDDIVICADVEISSDADVETVLVHIYDRVGKFLAPPVRFYTIQELLDKKLPSGARRTADNIFEGPILQHGFVDYSELEASALKQTIHVSDIIREIMDVKGVIAVGKILLTNISDGVPQTTGEEWRLTIAEGRAVRLDVKRSKIRFYKGIIPCPVDRDKVQDQLAELRELDRHKRLGKEDYDLAVPNGKCRNIRQYSLIRHDFPICYGIGREGLPRSATKLRKAQAKQLQAYLLLFDQLLANCLAQLAHVKDLFSINPNISKTYFSQPLCNIREIRDSEVPGVACLIKEFVEALDLAKDPKIDIDDIAMRKGWKEDWDKAIGEYGDRFPKLVSEREDLLENQRTYEDRKNRLLDHLMARFCERFTDYVLLMYSLDRSKAPTDLIEDKLDFLNDYPEISRNRGKAFNYKNQENLWDTEEVSGLQKRVARLMGIDSYSRRSLAHCIEGKFQISDGFQFRLVDNSGDTLLSGSRRYDSREEAEDEVYVVADCGCRKDSYKPDPANGGYQINLVDDCGKVIAEQTEGLHTKEDAEREIERIISFIEGINADCEGFHLIEHILLRPQESGDLGADEDNLLGVCVDGECNTCSGWIDPYSFRLTAVIPYWPRRFRNMEFRRLFEATLRQEARAEAHVKVCWVDRSDLRDFEQAYKAWLTENAKSERNSKRLSDRRKELIAALSKLRSVYPENRLYECVEGEESTPFLLDHSILGSTEEDQ
jgi:hypothetical protein